jgi:signal transduction histidine kinase
MSTSIAATVLNDAAHELRNQANVLLGGTRLHADEAHDEVASDTYQAASILAVLTDRLIEAARCDLHNENALAPCAVTHLIEAAIRRARRDWRINVSLQAIDGADAPQAEEVLVDAARAERVLADAFALAAQRDLPLSVSLEVGPMRVQVNEREKGSSSSAGEPVVPEKVIAPLAALMDGIGQASGLTVERNDMGAIRAIRFGGEQ